MYRDCRVFVVDILDSIGKIRSYVAGLSFDSFSQDSEPARPSGGAAGGAGGGSVGAARREPVGTVVASEVSGWRTSETTRSVTRDRCSCSRSWSTSNSSSSTSSGAATIR